jgi:phosphatidylglycerol---prolipoprotein diacylglyceryl transferase
VYPELFKIGDFVITSFGLMMFLSFLTAAWVTGLQLRRYGLPPELGWDMLAWCALAGIGGAKLYYLLLNWGALLADPMGEILNRGGLVWYGGLIGGVLAYYFQVRRRGLPLATMYDATAPALALGYGVGRLGCFLVGDDYGRYTEGPLGIAFPQGAPPSTAGTLRSMGETLPMHIPDYAVVAVHPTQLYMMALAVLMFAILWQLGGRATLRAGQLFAAYMVLYGLERFGIEFVRVKTDRLMIGGAGISTSQVASIVLVALGAWLWWRQGRVGAPAPIGGAAPAAGGDAAAAAGSAGAPAAGHGVAPAAGGAAPPPAGGDPAGVSVDGAPAPGAHSPPRPPAAG